MSHKSYTKNKGKRERRFQTSVHNTCLKSLNSNTTADTRTPARNAIPSSAHMTTTLISTMSKNIDETVSRTSRFLTSIHEVRNNCVKAPNSDTTADILRTPEKNTIDSSIQMITTLNSATLVRSGDVAGNKGNSKSGFSTTNIRYHSAHANQADRKSSNLCTKNVVSSTTCKQGRQTQTLPQRAIREEESDRSSATLHFTEQ